MRGAATPSTPPSLENSFQPSAASAPAEASSMVGSTIRWEESLAATNLVGSDRCYNSSIRTGSSSVATRVPAAIPRSVVRLPPSVIDPGTQPMAQLEAAMMEAKRGTTPSLGPCRCRAPRLCAKNHANSDVYCSQRRYVLRVFDEMAVRNAVNSKSLPVSVSSSIYLNRWPTS